MDTLEELALRQSLFNFFNFHAVEIISYIEKKTFKSSVNFFYFYIKPRVKKLNLPPLFFHHFLHCFEDLIYLIKCRGYSCYLDRPCKCNETLEKNDDDDCYHKQLRQVFLHSIKDVLTRFDLFQELCHEEITTNRYRRIYYEAWKKSIWEILFD